MRFKTVAVLLSAGLIGSGCATTYEVGRREHRSTQGIPAGHLPPPGMCRVWYSNRPPGHQPPPTSCREAERVARREPNARVIYSQQR